MPLRFVVAALVFVTLCGCFGRANPRISSFTRDSGAASRETSFEYDDAGRPTTVEEEGETSTLTWEGSLLVKLKREVDTGISTSITTTRYEYDGDKLIKVTREIDADNESETEIEYDAQGRLAKTSTSNNVDDDTSTSSFEYGDDGALVELVGESTTDVGTETVTTTSRFKLEYVEGKLGALSLSNDQDDNSIEIDASYADGRLEKLEVSVTQGAETAQAEVTYDYDDAGRIVGTTEEPDEGDDASVEIEYEDGDAANIDMAPSAVVFFPLWDLRGAPFTTLDTRTQVTRLIGGASW